MQLITSIAQKAGFGGGVVVDYPNSNKARKIFLCLFVGGGGGQQQVPKGLDGEDAVENGKARFERRRERERGRDRTGKRKNIKDRDWLLKKKEVSYVPLLLLSSCFNDFFFSISCTASEEKKGFQEILNLQDASGEQYSDMQHLHSFCLSFL